MDIIMYKKALDFISKLYGNRGDIDYIGKIPSKRNGRPVRPSSTPSKERHPNRSAYPERGCFPFSASFPSAQSFIRTRS